MAYNGTNTKCQLSIESTWGTNPASGDTLLAIQSEGLKYNIESKSEDTLISGKTVSAIDIMGVGVDGELALLARPETIGYILGLAFGAEATPTVTAGGTLAYDHEFTLMESTSSNTLPSTTIIVDRKAAVKAFTGCKVDTLTLSASAKDYLQCKATFKGKTEEAGTIDGALNIPTKKPFKFINGSIKVNGSSVGYVTSVSINTGNSLDDGAPTLGSGIYGTEADVQSREVGITLESFYDANTEVIRENYFKTGATISTELLFESTEEAETDIPYTLKIVIPNIFITDANPTISGKEKIQMTITGSGTEVGVTEPITVTVIDLKSDEYVS